MSQPNKILQTNLPGVAIGDWENATPQPPPNQINGLPASVATTSSQPHQAPGFPWCVNVKDGAYGAKGDGITDDTAAIQAAINAAQGEVFFPAGVYLISSTLTLPYTANGIVLRGAGAGLTGAAQTTINYTGSSFFAVLGGGTTGNFTRYQRIEDMEIVGTSSAIGGIRFFSTRWCAVKRCTIRGFTGAGVASILLDASNVAQYPNYFNVIEDNWIDGSAFGIYLRGDSSGAGANSNFIQRNTFTNCASVGIISDGGDTNRITRNELSSGTGIGVQITSINTPALYNTVELNQFDGCASGINNSGTQTQIGPNTGGSYSVTDTGTASKYLMQAPGAGTSVSRVLGTVYQPNTARPTLVVATLAASGANAWGHIKMDASSTPTTTIADIFTGSTAITTAFSFIVPPGFYYEFVQVNATVTINFVFEFTL